MYWRILCILVFLCAGFGLVALTLAQEDVPPESSPLAQPPGTEDAEAPEVVATFGSKSWHGEVYIKKSGADEFEIASPVGEQKAAVRFGDTVMTSQGASVELTVTDGTVIALGPETEVVFERSPDGLVIARLIYGQADVTFGGDQFRFVCARNTISGENGTCVRVMCPDPNTASILGVDDTATVTNDFGFVVYLDQGQQIESTYVEEEKVFQVTVDEYNEIGLRIEVGDEGKMIDPGLSFTVDADLNFRMFGRVEETSGGEEVTLLLPLELEEPEDEPFEDSGDLESIYVVSPTKP